VSCVVRAVPAFGPAEEVQNLRRTSDVEYGVAQRYIWQRLGFMSCVRIFRASEAALADVGARLSRAPVTWHALSVVAATGQQKTLSLQTGAHLGF
jgi:hypothetical protein